MIDRVLTGATLWLLWIIRRIISLDRRAYMLLSAGALQPFLVRIGMLRAHAGRPDDQRELARLASGCRGVEFGASWRRSVIARCRRQGRPRLASHAFRDTEVSRHESDEEQESAARRRMR